MKYCLIFVLATVVSTDIYAEKQDVLYNSVAAITLKDGDKAAEAFADAVVVNIRPECREMLVPVLASIRYAENGRPGIEYGVLHPKAKNGSYRTQAGWSAATVQKQFDRYCKAGGDPKDVAAYLISLRDRYCPIGADNDPTNLNEHWLRNVSKFRSQIVNGTLKGRK